MYKGGMLFLIKHLFKVTETWLYQCLFRKMAYFAEDQKWKEDRWRQVEQQGEENKIRIQ